MGWLLLLLLLDQDKKRRASGPPLPPVGTNGIVRPSNKPPIPVRVEVASGGNAVWAVQNLASSNLTSAQAALRADVGRAFRIEVSAGRSFVGRWNGFVFVPEPV